LKGVPQKVDEHLDDPIPRKETKAMKETIKVALVLLGATLFLSGCAGIGPGTVSRDRFDYTTAISDSWKSQMLLNMVKLRYGDTPIFLDVASVISSYEFSGSASLGANWKFRPSYESGASIGAGGFYADRPTITYSPLTGEKFSKSMLTPVPPSAIFFFIQAGYNVNAVFRVLVQSINGIQNRYGGIGRGRPADPEFFLLIEKMSRIQDSGAYEIRVQKSTEREALAAVFSDKVDKNTEADITEVRKMLGLDPRAREFRVVYGSISSGDKEIAILSRSVLQVINNLASYIEVPETHVAEKRVNPSLVEKTANGTPVPPIMQIRSSSEKPEDAFVAVPYLNHWFWIDGKDLRSKALFSFLMFIFNLVDTGIKEGAPVVTIPAR
jgi:hypothetical protein